MTDLLGVLRITRYNIKENLDPNAHKACVRVLDWTQQKHAQDIGTADLIIAADILYNESTLDDLICTLYWLSDDSTEIILVCFHSCFSILSPPKKKILFCVLMTHTKFRLQLYVLIMPHKLQL